MNLRTRYLGLDLRNPLIAGAGPLNGQLDNIRRLEDLGAGAIVLPSIFEEQIEHEQGMIDQLIYDWDRQLRGSLDVFSRANRLCLRAGPLS